MTAGQIATAFDSSMGFRHGPKSFVNSSSLAFVFVSNDDYTRQYDIDIFKQLHGDQIARLVPFAVGVDAESDFEGLSFSFDKEYRFVPDAYLALPYAVFGQTVSLLSSIKVGTNRTLLHQQALLTVS